jgi:hypothetical protein
MPHVLNVDVRALHHRAVLPTTNKMLYLSHLDLTLHFTRFPFLQDDLQLASATRQSWSIVMNESQPAAGGCQQP